MLDKVVKILRMEFRMTAANKAFVVITILGPFILLLMMALPNLINRTAASIKDGTKVAIVGADDLLFASLTASTEGTAIEFVRSVSAEESEEALLNREIGAYIAIPDNYLQMHSYNYFSKTGAEVVLIETVRHMIGTSVVFLRMQEAGLDAEKIQTLSATPQLNIQKVAQDSGPQDIGTTMMTVISFTLILYMTILLYGQSAARSVIKDKTSKTVEILLSSVRPIELLLGKLFGQAAAGLLQYALWISVAGFLAKIVGPSLGISMPASITASTFAYLVLFFILAFFLYSSAYAAIGAGAEDESHLSQLSWPLLLFLILPMMTSSAIIMNPDMAIARIFSLFPFSAPIVMFIRILIGSPQTYEIVLCIAILLITVVAMVLISAKIFRVGILMTGKRFTLREILRWARY